MMFEILGTVQQSAIFCYTLVRYVTIIPDLHQLAITMLNNQDCTKG